MRGDDLVAAMQAEAARLARRAPAMKLGSSWAVYDAAGHAGRALLDAAAAYRTFTDALDAERASKGD